MKEIIIKNRKKTDLTDEALYSLFQQSFQLWHDKGIDTPFIHTTWDKFQEKLRKESVFVAQDVETGELLGMHFLLFFSKHRYAFGSFLAVAPKYQSEGIASRMLNQEAEMIRQRGYRYMIETTSVAATWSVRWHLKNGYHIVGYSLSDKSNTANYTFRKQLVPISFSSLVDVKFFLCHPVYALYCNAAFCRLRFIATYLATRLLKRSDGHLNPLGRIAKSIISKK